MTILCASMEEFRAVASDNTRCDGFSTSCDDIGPIHVAFKFNEDEPVAVFEETYEQVRVRAALPEVAK